MNKTIIAIITLFCVFIGIVNINAKTLVEYNDGVGYIEEYLKQYNDYDKYIEYGENVKYGYSTIPVINNKFIYGAFLNKSEYEIAGGFNSYLTTGMKYYTMTETTDSAYNITPYDATLIPKTTKSNIRITEYVKNDIILKGEGSYIEPWEFIF